MGVAQAAAFDQEARTILSKIYGDGLIYKGQCLAGARLEQHRLHHARMVERSYLPPLLERLADREAALITALA